MGSSSRPRKVKLAAIIFDSNRKPIRPGAIVRFGKRRRLKGINYSRGIVICYLPVGRDEGFLVRVVPYQRRSGTISLGRRGQPRTLLFEGNSLEVLWKPGNYC